MAASFEAVGLELPPWRKTQPMLSKWMPERSRDLSLAGATGWLVWVIARKVLGSTPTWKEAITRLAPATYMPKWVSMITTARKSLLIYNRKDAAVSSQRFSAGGTFMHSPFVLCRSEAQILDNWIRRANV